MIRAAGREQLTVEGRAGTAVGTAMENGDVRGGRKMGDRGGGGETGIYACEPERPLYVVDAIIYDTYRSQLRVMALTLVFMAILFLVAFHSRRRGCPLSPFFPALIAACSWETLVRMLSRR